MKTEIRQIVAEQGRLRVAVDKVRDDQDLFKVGLSSFSAVQVMLALEEHFDVEFPETKMVRGSFVNINTIVCNIHELQANS